MVHSEPCINLCCTTKNGSIKPVLDTEDRGDVLIRILWKKINDFIIDVRVTYTDSKYDRNEDPQKVLEVVERLKKNKCLQPCLYQWHHFTLFFVSVDSLLGKEEIMIIKILIENQAQKTGAVILLPLWISSGPTQYHDCRSITYMSARI
jgi:hypothetical protein